MIVYGIVFNLWLVIVMIDLKINLIVVIFIFTALIGLIRQYLGYRLDIASWKISYLKQRIEASVNRKEKFHLRSMIVLKFLDYLNLVLIILFLVTPIFINFIVNLQ